jgi:outer membrane biogenesis lipoprotein LolB
MQDGWRIEFQKYKAVKQYVLPHKLFLSRQDKEIDVRLIIREWSL